MNAKELIAAMQKQVAVAKEQNKVIGLRYFCKILLQTAY
jgi:hypothetical protein